MASAAVLRGVTPRTLPLARRRFLAGLLLTGAGLPLLAACGSAATSSSSTTSTASPSGAVQSGTVAGTTAPAGSQASATVAVTSAVTSTTSSAAPATTSAVASPAASQAGAPRTLLLWPLQRTYDTGTIGAMFIQEFAQQHPELKVVSEPIPSWNKVPPAVAAGSGPDLAYMDRYLAAEWGNKGIIQPLNALIQGVQGLDAKDWRQGLLSDVSWKGKIYAYPQGSGVWVFYWNKPAYQQVGLPVDAPPATWDELKQSAQKLYRANADGSIDRYGFAPQFGNGGAQAAWLVFMWQQGQDELSPDRTKAIFNTDKGLNALNTVIDFVTMQGGMQRYTDFVKGLSSNARAAALPAGKVVSHLDTMSDPDQFWKPAWPALTPDTFGTGLIPKPPGGTDTTYQGGPTFVVTTPAKNPADGARFLAYINTAANQLRWADGANLVPTSISVCQSSAYLDKDPVRKVYVPLALNAKWVPSVPGAADILTVHTQLMNDALNGTKTAHDALTSAQTEIQKILDKNLQGT